jgi:hypothetical protein
MTSQCILHKVFMCTHYQSLGKMESVKLVILPPHRHFLPKSEFSPCLCILNNSNIHNLRRRCKQSRCRHFKLREIQWENKWEPFKNFRNTIEKQLRTMLTHISGMWDIKGRNFGNLESVHEQLITKGLDSEY